MADIKAFLTIVKVSVIPCLEKMIEEETKHISFLKAFDTQTTKGLIIKSENILKDLTVRLEDYKVFLRENLKQ